MRNTATPPVHNFYMIAKTMLKFKNYFLMFSLFAELQTLDRSYALQKLNHCFQQRTSVYPLLIFVLSSYYALHHSVTDIVVLPMWSHANSPLITYMQLYGPGNWQQTGDIRVVPTHLVFLCAVLTIIYNCASGAVKLVLFIVITIPLNFYHCLWNWSTMVLLALNMSSSVQGWEFGHYFI